MGGLLSCLPSAGQENNSSGDTEQSLCSLVPLFTHVVAITLSLCFVAFQTTFAHLWSLSLHVFGSSQVHIAGALQSVHYSGSNLAVCLKYTAENISHWPHMLGVSPQPWSQELPGSAVAPLGPPCSDQAVALPSLTGVTVVSHCSVTHLGSSPSVMPKLLISSASFQSFPTPRELHVATSGFSCRSCHRCPWCVKAVEISLSCWVVLTHQAVSICFYLSIHNFYFCFFPRQNWTS